MRTTHKSIRRVLTPLGRDQAEATDDPDAKAFFGQLADWESGHYHALLQQQETLKEDYWAAGGFAPF